MSERAEGGVLSYVPANFALPVAPLTGCRAAAQRRALDAFHRYLQLSACGAPTEVLMVVQAELDACLHDAELDEQELIPLYPRYRLFALCAEITARTGI